MAVDAQRGAGWGVAWREIGGGCGTVVRQGPIDTQPRSGVLGPTRPDGCPRQSIIVLIFS